jgi:hypothetical protein
MIEVDENENEIAISRGDSCTLDVTIPLEEDNYYVFQPGDLIKLRVYEKNGYDKEVKLEKEVVVDCETEIAQIVLEESDTLFAPISNKRLIYWYDISLNEDKTIIGYDNEDGPKQFIITPAKGGNE